MCKDKCAENSIQLILCLVYYRMKWQTLFKVTLSYVQQQLLNWKPSGKWSFDITICVFGEPGFISSLSVFSFAYFGKDPFMVNSAGFCRPDAWTPPHSRVGMLIPRYVESRDPNRQSRVPTWTRKGRNRRTYGE